MKRIAFITALALLALPAGAHAAYPGQNGKLAFESGAPVSGISTSYPDGSARTQITSGRDLSPVWSPDGQRIAFVRREPGGSCATCISSLHVVDADGGNDATVLMSGDGDFTISSPTWSPDGNRIAFTRYQGGSYLWAVNSDGSGLGPIGNAPGTPGLDPSWSPDGSRVAYDVGNGIYTVRPDGSDRQTVIPPGPEFTGPEPAFPDWSPDGLKIAFENVYDCDGDTARVIMLANADGTGPQQVAGDPCFVGTPEPPSWAPDGTAIVSIDFAIFTIHTDGTGYFNTGIFGFRPDWQPIITNEPPDCSGVVASRPVLGTVNRRLVPLTLDGVTDPDGDPVTLAIDAITQDEPVRGPGDATSPDAIDEGDGEVRVRAERNPHGDGRVYRIAFTASDPGGASCSGIAKVAVPRHRKKPAVDSSPPSYDSLSR
jgi:WD40-like Beta Propeller Repeat